MVPRATIPTPPGTAPTTSRPIALQPKRSARSGVDAPGARVDYDVEGTGLTREAVLVRGGRERADQRALGNHLAVSARNQVVKDFGATVGRANDGHRERLLRRAGDLFDGYA